MPHRAPPSLDWLETRPARTRRKRGDPRTLPRLRGQAARERGPRADAELAIDVGEMRLDGPVADEERRRDLPVRPPLGDERGDPLLGGGQPAVGRSAAADAAELGA